MQVSLYRQLSDTSDLIEKLTENQMQWKVAVVRVHTYTAQTILELWKVETRKRRGNHASL